MILDDVQICIEHFFIWPWWNFSMLELSTPFTLIIVVYLFGGVTTRCYYNFIYLLRVLFSTKISYFLFFNVHTIYTIYVKINNEVTAMWNSKLVYHSNRLERSSDK